MHARDAGPAREVCLTMRFLQLILAVPVAVACGDSSGPRQPVAVEPASLTLVPGDTARLRVVDAPAPIRWRSDAPTIATVNTTGLVTAVASGDTRVWAVRGADSAAASVVVTRGFCILAAVISPVNAEITVGDTVRAEARITCGSPAGIVWTSGDAAVASVVGRGAETNPSTATVTGRRPGQVVITASLADSPSVNVSMAVVVRAP